MAKEDVIVSARATPRSKEKFQEIIKAGQKKFGAGYSSSDAFQDMVNYCFADPYSDFFDNCKKRPKGEFNKRKQAPADGQ